MSVVVALTGASGAVYGRRLVEVLCRAGIDVHFVVSAAGVTVAGHELGEDPRGWPQAVAGGGSLTLWENGDLTAPFASGSNPPRGMAIAPCSMGTLGRIASGVSDSLVTRAADVCLKERIPVVALARETPLSLIHIENMAAFTRAGGVVLPPAPAFYHRPGSVGDLVDFIIGKTLRILGVPHELFPPWRGE